LGVETEIKVRIGEPELFLAQLNKLRPILLSKRHFEDNFVLDFADGRLASGLCLLRVRVVDGPALLTFKGPPQPSGLFKIREELESSAADGQALLAILKRLGLRVSFRYQKYRREFRVSTGPGRRGEIHVVLDETPIGTFAEFEGSGAGIRKLARALGIREARFLRDSYASLYVDFCRKRKQAVRHMTFRSVRARSGYSALASRRKDKS